MKIWRTLFLLVTVSVLGGCEAMDALVGAAEHSVVVPTLNSHFETAASERNRIKVKSISIKSDAEQGTILWKKTAGWSSAPRSKPLRPLTASYVIKEDFSSAIKRVMVKLYDIDPSSSLTVEADFSLAHTGTLSRNGFCHFWDWETSSSIEIHLKSEEKTISKELFFADTSDTFCVGVPLRTFPLESAMNEMVESSYNEMWLKVVRGTPD